MHFVELVIFREWHGGQRYYEEELLMATGTVKWFNPAKGFGFIEPDDGGEDAFVHISAVEQAGLSTLQEGQKVNFELQPGRNGKSSAENLTIASWVTCYNVEGLQSYRPSSMTSMEKAKSQREELGFKPETEKYGDCVLRLMEMN